MVRRFYLVAVAVVLLAANSDAFIQAPGYKFVTRRRFIERSLFQKKPAQNCATQQQPLTSTGVSGSADDEADALISQAEIAEETLKYQPSVDLSDPISSALTKISPSSTGVKSFELLDSRWNGNEVFKYVMNDEKLFFVKLNRVEHPSVFTSEAVSLSALKKASSLKSPLPMHIGELPRVGEFGPGSFMILEWLPIVPFGAMQSQNQKLLGLSLAELHKSTVHDALHKGRFGFPTSNFLAVTPMNNTWTDTWEELFARRLTEQLERLAPSLQEGDVSLVEKGAIILDHLDFFLAGTENIKPSLIHGDLWIGNTGATETEPVIFDPCCSFSHGEFELSPCKMFGGFTEDFFSAYHEAMGGKKAGWEVREKLYLFYHYMNQLNLFGDTAVKKNCEDISSDLCRMLSIGEKKREKQ